MVIPAGVPPPSSFFLQAVASNVSATAPRRSFFMLCMKLIFVRAQRNRALSINANSLLKEIYSSYVK
jgi:hypothetical protein